jgi:hypothetical protein
METKTDSRDSSSQLVPPAQAAVASLNPDKLAQKLPNHRVSAVVQSLLAELFRVAITTPQKVADVSVDFQGSDNSVNVSGWSRDGQSFQAFAYCSGDYASAKCAAILADLSGFLSGAWVVCGDYSGASQFLREQAVHLAKSDVSAEALLKYAVSDGGAS